MEMPLAYLSYSAWYLYQKDPSEFYAQYYIGRDDAATPKMKLGKIFQEAWCDGKFPFADELKKEGFTSDFERVMRSALGNPSLLKVQKKDTERKYVVNGAGLQYPIMGIFDGEYADGSILENKYGAPWNEKRVAESDQITWYSLVQYVRTKKIPFVTLQSVNSKNGKVGHFKVKRTKADIVDLVRRINEMVARVRAGDFNLR